MGSLSDAQHIWIYCAQRHVAREVENFCIDVKRRSMIPKVVEPQTSEAPWLRLLHTQLGGSPPPPYRKKEWVEFSVDLMAYVSASRAWGALVLDSSLDGPDLLAHASSQATSDGARQSLRWPALLVSDRSKLLSAVVEPEIRDAVAKLAELPMDAMLPIILKEDFPRLSGELVEAPPLDFCDSLLFASSPSKVQGEHNSSTRMHVEPQVSDKPELFVLRLGVYLAQGSVTERLANGGELLYGARVLCLYGNMHCLYCAISLDGLYSVEAHGTWEVVNGNIVIGGRNGHAQVRHMKLSHHGGVELDKVAYEQPVFLPLKQLFDEFETYIDLTETDSYMFQPSFRNKVKSVQLAMRMGSWQDNKFPGSPEVLSLFKQASGQTSKKQRRNSALPPLGASLFSLTKQVTPAQLTATSNTKSEAGWWHIARSLQQTYDPRWEVFVRKQPLIQKRPACLSRRAMSEHVLMRHVPSDRRNQGNRSAKEWDKLKSSLDALQNTLRSSTELLENKDAEEDGSGIWTSFGDLIQALGRFDMSVPGDRRSLAHKEYTSIVAPGRYTYSSGEADSFNLSTFELCLHADGRCDYHERSQGFPSKFLRTTSQTVVWHVQDGLLIMQASPPKEYGFKLRQLTGFRMTDCLVASVKVQVRFMLDKCTYTPFSQVAYPFPGQSYDDTSQRIFGLIDHNSPAIPEVCAQGRHTLSGIPYEAFEYAMRELQVDFDEILTVFCFMDGDGDGEINIGELCSLQSFGSVTAPPETIEELRLALIHIYGTTVNAWMLMQAMADTMNNGKVSFGVFHSFLKATAEENIPARKKGKNEDNRLMKEFVEKYTEEDLMLVFATCNPQKKKHIELSDFIALSFHAAVSAVRHMQHFQLWLRREYGDSKESYWRFFRDIDADSSGEVTRHEIACGTRALGYSGSTASISTAFALLDRNWDGSLQFTEFARLRSFDGNQLLSKLISLGCFVEEKYNSIEACFDNMRKREHAARGLSVDDDLPNSVSWDVFNRFFRSNGYVKSESDVDMKLCFLFLEESVNTEGTNRRSNGYLDIKEWSLLHGFRSSVVVGNPAHACEVLEEEFGDLTRAFVTIHAGWLKRALAKGLMQVALRRVNRQASNPFWAQDPLAEPSEAAKRKLRKSKSTPLLMPSSSNMCNGKTDTVILTALGTQQQRHAAENEASHSPCKSNSLPTLAPSKHNNKAGQKIYSKGNNIRAGYQRLRIEFPAFGERF